MVSEEEKNLFISETEGLIKKIEEEIIKLEKEPTIFKPIQELFFVFNGLTGLIKMINLENVLKFNLLIENMLKKAKDTEIPKNKVYQFINLMFKNLEILKSVVNDVKKGEIKDLENEDLDRLKNNIDDFEKEYEITFINPISHENLELALIDKNFYKISIQIKETCKFKKVRLFFIFRALNNIGQICYSRPEPELLERGEFDLDFEIFFISKETTNEIISVLNEILEIEKSVVQEISIDKFKKVIEDKLKKEKQEDLKQLKSSAEDSEIEFKKKFITPISLEELKKIKNDFNNIFYKIYIRLKLTCKLKKLRAFLILRTLNNLGQIIWTNPDPDTLEKGEFNLDFEIFLISQKNKNEIANSMNELLDVANKAIKETNFRDFEDIINEISAEIQEVQIYNDETIPEKEIVKQEDFVEKVLEIERKVPKLEVQERKSFPQIIFTNNSNDMIKKIFLAKNQFVKLIIKDKHDIVFSCNKDNDQNQFYLYIVKEGICFVAEEEEFQDFKDIFNIKEGGFTNFHDYLEAIKYGIDNSVEYLAFKKNKSTERKLE
ncbi:MAG: hypothetical protein ACTSRI_16465 [Promethearchaeota archaeon]